MHSRTARLAATVMAATVMAAAIIAGNAACRAETAGSGPRIGSELSVLNVTPMAAMPPAPAETKDIRNCADYTVAPASEGGKLAAQLGWAVLKEAMLGPYQLVAVSGQMEQSTSNRCIISEGLIAIFSGSHILALIAAPQGSDQLIGMLEPLEGDRVRIWSGAFLQKPIGDLRLEPEGGLTLGPMADRDLVCGGKAMVPNVYGLPIGKARTMLTHAGWKPTRVRATPDEYGQQKTLRASGITEVDTCAGTGLGFCNFDYHSATGKLEITTADDDGTDTPFSGVIGYSVTCSAGRQ